MAAGMSSTFLEDWQQQQPLSYWWLLSAVCFPHSVPCRVPFAAIVKRGTFLNRRELTRVHFAEEQLKLEPVTAMLECPESTVYVASKCSVFSKQEARSPHHNHDHQVEEGHL